MLIETTLPLLFLVCLLRQFNLLFLVAELQRVLSSSVYGIYLANQSYTWILLPSSCICSMSVCLYVCQQNASSRLAKSLQTSYSIQTSLLLFPIHVKAVLFAYQLIGSAPFEIAPAHMVLRTRPYTNTLFVLCITSGAKPQQIAQGK